MGNFSRDTFDKLKHYVGVRLQQGVPLVDADWNEQEDIRKYELQAFLKWFIGDGVPSGNDGFRIVPVLGGLLGKIIIIAKKSTLEIDLVESTAAAQLGFDSSNQHAERQGPPAQLIGSRSGPFGDLVGKKLVIKTRDLPTEAWSSDAITFRAEDFKQPKQAEASEVAVAINRAAAHLTAAVGGENDFAIRGGDGTPDGAGRCLVDGWDVLNESDLRYTEQPLYNDPTLKQAWGVDPLPILTTPAATRTDTVYLDVWEREVTRAGDPNLVNPSIDIETCVRIKREWVVRVAEDLRNTPKTPTNHVFYPLATLKRPAGSAAIAQDQIVDLRRTGVTMTDLVQRVASLEQRVASLEQYVASLEGGPTFDRSHEFDPDRGQPGTEVTLHGNNFNVKGVSVIFGSELATIVGTPTATDIVAEVPHMSPGKVVITVKTGKETVTSDEPFEVTPPPPTFAFGNEFEPPKGRPGTTVTLHGDNFNVGGLKVSIGGGRARIEGTPTANQIIAVVPNVIPTSGHIRVETDGGWADSTQWFTVL